MTHKAYIVGESESSLWGISSTQRLTRQLRSLGVAEVCEVSTDSLAQFEGLIIDGRYVFDSNVLLEIVSNNGTYAIVSDDVVVAIKSSYKGEEELCQFLSQSISLLPNTFSVVHNSGSSTYNDHLRRKEPPLLTRLDPTNIEKIEAQLYGNSYKGITDFITKWLWPKPAKKMVRILSDARISPNAVTLLSLLLVIMSSILFSLGYFLTGLILGWIMTFLDTVDGKLARVTITSSRLGHFLDHGMDIIHPPIWYACWINGLLIQSHVDAATAVFLNILIICAYIFGRAIEALFHALGNCSIFAWRPFDAFCRLFSARRNPCLVLLSLGIAFSSSKMGLYAVCGWTLVSSFILGIRFMQALFVRICNGPLESWLKNEEIAMKNNPVFYRMFSNTQKAYE